MKNTPTNSAVKDANVLAKSQRKKSGIWLIILGFVIGLIVNSIIDFLFTLFAFIPIIGWIIAIVANFCYFYTLVTLIIQFVKDLIAYNRFGITV
ncbi:MAG: hypothetical protein IKB23_05085, partial [Clostridia bacterium]|nr:hypothetical protein [Clostridia bacterium]